MRLKISLLNSPLLFGACQPSETIQKKALSLIPLFSDHLVLQQQQEVAIWGEYTAKTRYQ